MNPVTAKRGFGRIALVTVAAAAAFGLGACGSSEGEKHGGEEIVVEGEPFEVGPLRYNVLFTRPLNKYDVEDREYLVGQPDAGPDEIYLGVFVQVSNTDEEKPHKVPETFELVDTSGRRFENLETRSIYRLNTGELLGPGDEEPTIDSTPQVGPIQAAMLLYKVDDETLELRPVELEIPGEEEGEVVRAELDL